MALDDPVVIGLIVLAIILLFGATRIPALARSFGQAKREFQKASQPNSSSSKAGVSIPVTAADEYDPLVVAARGEGIDTAGKTREEIASELSDKINNEKDF